MKIYSVLFAGLLIVSCRRGEEMTNPTLEAISESVYASGIVKSKNQYQVYSTVNGLIQEIMVREGDSIGKGNALMKVLNESSKLNAYNAKLAADYADLDANAGKLKEAAVSIDLARSKMKNDSLLMARQRNLKAQGIGSQVELEQRELAYKNSVTTYEVAALNYHDLKRQLSFAAGQSKVNLKLSNTLAGDYFIRAERSGKVYKVLKEKGEFANTLTPVAVIGDANEFILELNVDEYDIARIREGQPIVFSMDSYKGDVFEASVQKIEPMMNNESRSFTVNAVFVTRPTVLYPNLSVEANIIIRSKEKALTIPRSYLIADSLVMLKNHTMRKVVVGIKDYQKVEIKSGLTTKDIIYKPLP